MPCWVDLATRDVQAAQRFYTAVLGWSYQDADEDFGGYAIANLDGGATAGIGPMMGDQQRSSWTLYLASDDADQAEAAITQHGGTVLVPAGDVGPLGRMLIASDPAGGVFGVWQAGTHIGASVVSEPGALVWEDLRSTDPDLARQFYGSVFGFDFEVLPAAGPDYTTFHLPGDEAPLGGVGGMAGAPEGAPSHWLVYLGVADADVAVQRAAENAGHVLVPPFDSPYGRMAVIADPAGATFCAFQLASDQIGPDRGE
jgi:predicted enzyme related to lactoylglutathione lyase